MIMQYQNEFHLKYGVLCFTAVGFWPIRTANRTAALLYHCYFALFSTIAVGLVLSIFMELPKLYKSRGMKPFLNYLAIALNFLFNLIQSNSCIWATSKLLQRKIQTTEKNIMKNGTRKLKALFMVELKRYEALNVVFLISSMLCDGFYVIAPWIAKYYTGLENPDEPMLPLDCWFPFNKYFYYKTAFLFTTLGGASVSAFSIGSYYIYFGMLRFVLTQFAILKYEIIEGIDGRLEDYKVHENIRKIVKFYNNIIGFVQQLNNVLRYLMLLAAGIFVEQTSILCFQLVTENLSLQLVKSIILMNVLLLELSLFYWLANEVTLENYKVADAIWNSDWYNCSTSVKKSLILVIMRSRKPLQLLVGPFYFMSNKTLVMILKTSLSYAAALRKFHNLKTENS